MLSDPCIQPIDVKEAVFMTVTVNSSHLLKLILKLFLPLMLHKKNYVTLKVI